MKVLVTGGSGFIGSNFIKYLLTGLDFKEIQVVNLDKLTYAGQGKNIEHLGLNKDQRYKFIKGDISDKEFIDKLFLNEKFDMVFNFAAESHVDRSIVSSEDFIMSNVTGVTNLLDASLKYGIKKFIQISTDEVYGSIKNGSFIEQDNLNPSSPYSASKASADVIALSYYKTHKLPVVITRSANNYGIYQFPEKILPLFITNLIEGKKVPLMWSEENPGLNVRDWLHVEDNCRAIWFVGINGRDGEIYNIPGENERTNLHMTKLLLKYFNLGEEMIEKIEHRKGHDFRYSINGDKLKRLGFVYTHKDLELEIQELVEWYKKNDNWWKKLKAKKVLITGGLGFIGSRLAELCVNNGYKVTLISRSDAKIKNIEHIKDKVDLILKDVKDISKEVEGFDLIFHLAGSTDNYAIKEGQPYKDLEMNCVPTLALLEAIKKYNPKARLIFASTFFVNGNKNLLPINENSRTDPLGLYGATRLAAEHFCKIYHNVFDLDIVIMRFTNVFGEKEQASNKKAGFNYLIEQAVKGKDLDIYNNGNFFRDYIHVDDVVSACLKIAEKGETNQIYYVGNGEFIKFKQLIDIIVRELGVKINPIEPPDFHKRVGITDFVADISKLKSLGWQPKVSVEEGIKRTIDYYKQQKTEN